MGLKREGYFWTSEQIQYLKDNYHNFSLKELSKILNKTEKSIGTKAYKLGISISNRWTDEEINFLQDNYSLMKNDEIINSINRERHCIVDKAMELGLKKDNSTYKKFSKEDQEAFLDNVSNYANELGRTPLAREIFSQEWCFPNATLNRYFGGYRNICKLLDLDINVNIFGSRYPMYKSKNNDLCWSKAELYITNYFIDNNINYIKEVFYKDYCNDKRFNNKSSDWIIGSNIFIEYFGMMDKDYYAKKAYEKIKLCNENNIKLICLYEEDIVNLDKIFEDFIPNK